MDNGRDAFLSLLSRPPPPPFYPATSSFSSNRLYSQKRLIRTIVRASEEDYDKPAFNPFGFVTDNPSNRNSIQLPESPAEDGNVGQMLYRIEDKGKEYGSYIKSGGFRWFVRETDAGFHCLAPDWIGFGFSDKPQSGYGYDYTEKEFHEVFDKLLDTLGVISPFFLVVQGFLVGSYGLTWALKNQNRIFKLAILNTPLTTSSPLPGLFQQLRIPLLGEFTCQNAVMAERFIEAGSAYVLKLEKEDV